MKIHLKNFFLPLLFLTGLAFPSAAQDYRFYPLSGDNQIFIITQDSPMWAYERMKEIIKEAKGVHLTDDDDSIKHIKAIDESQDASVIYEIEIHNSEPTMVTIRGELNPGSVDYPGSQVSTYEWIVYQPREYLPVLDKGWRNMKGLALDYPNGMLGYADTKNRYGTNQKE